MGYIDPLLLQKPPSVREEQEHFKRLLTQLTSIHRTHTPRAAEEYFCAVNPAMPLAKTCPECFIQLFYHACTNQDAQCAEGLHFSALH